MQETRRSPGGTRPQSLRPGFPGWASGVVVAGSLAQACVPEGPPTSKEEARPPSPADGPASAGDPPSSGVFVDDFERDSLGDHWRPLSPRWAIRDGQLCVRGAKNRGVWLKRRLPRNARIELDARSDSPQGDIKLELWGDGRSGATAASYDDATGYIAIFGGWSNRLHVLARLDEHGADRAVTEVRDGEALPRAQVVPGRTYHFRIERRDGKTLRWWVDDVLMHSFADPQPLYGLGHDHLGLSDWMTPVCFDNLEVTPL